MKLAATVKEAVADSEVETSQKKPAKRVLALPHLDHAKMAVLNSVTSASGQRTYDHAIREFVALVLLHVGRKNDSSGAVTTMLANFFGTDEVTFSMASTLLRWSRRCAGTDGSRTRQRTSSTLAST